MKYVFLFLFITVSITNIFAQRSTYAHQSVIKHITKPLIVPFLLLFYITAVPKVENLLIMALLFGWLGDIIIIFHHVYKSETGYVIQPIIAGLGAFFVGHVFYMLLFIKYFNDFKPFYILPYLVVGLLTAVVLFHLGILKSNDSKLNRNKRIILKIAIVLYTMVIMSMSLMSIYTGIRITIIGTLCFLISDSILSLKEFGQIPLPESFVMITYILAQCFIILGFIEFPIG